MKRSFSLFLISAFLLLFPYLCQAATVILTNTSPDATITAGSNTKVYGTAGANHITLQSGAKAELFNFPGNNTITIQSDSSLFTVSRSGAYVTFEGTDGTVLKMPATMSDHAIVFNDMSLVLVINNSQVTLGGQNIDEFSFDMENPSNEDIELFINNDNNQISGFPGKLLEAKINIVSESDNNNFIFKIISGPTEIAVNADGVITYQIPQNSETEVFIPFEVSVLDTSSNNVYNLEGSIYIMEVVVIGSGIVTSEGGLVSDLLEDIVVEIHAGTVSEDVEIKIIQSKDALGRNIITFDIDGNIDGTFDIHLPDPVSLNSNNSINSLQISKNKDRISLKSSNNYPLNYTWSTEEQTLKYFSQKNDCRLPNGTTDLTLTQNQLKEIKGLISDNAYKLMSTEPNPIDPEILDGEPVLFIHGYLAGDGFGGGEGTWENFPLLISNIKNEGISYIPFEFQWRTNARFQDVADDIGKCLKLIAAKTNKKVHIVAHSFGGVLTRTLLQNLNNDGVDYSSNVASVTTLGTPHSGIYDKQKTLHGISFPAGQGSWQFEGAGQISTHQMGEYDSFISNLHEIFKVNETEGKLAADLVNTAGKISAGLPIQVGIGLTTWEYANDTIDNGDRLITYEGQRFHPDLTNTGNFKELLDGSTDYGGTVTEFILGFGRDVHPGDNNDENIRGYKHTGFGADDSTPSEARVQCTDNNSCDHPSYKAVEAWLSLHSGSGGTYSDTITNSLGMTFVSIPAGTFMMGSPEDEPGRIVFGETQHQVTLTQGYYMQTTEVTQGQWEAVMGSNPSYYSDCGSDCPVETVSWDDAHDFIAALNIMGEGTYSLPTEAQWEYAARAGSTTAFANGDITETDCAYDPNLGAMGWYCYNSSSTPHPVAQKNANTWGLYDMHGNVWEWCQDWYDSNYYNSGSMTNPEGPSSGWYMYRVIRGGSCFEYARYCRSANRDRGSPGYEYSGRIGFRLVLSPGQRQ